MYGERISSTSVRLGFLKIDCIQTFQNRLMVWIEFGSYIGDNKFVYHFRIQGRKSKPFCLPWNALSYHICQIMTIAVLQNILSHYHNWTPQNADCPWLRRSNIWTSNPSVANCMPSVFQLSDIQKPCRIKSGLPEPSILNITYCMFHERVRDSRNFKLQR
jgi:hypothetical protein